MTASLLPFVNAELCYCDVLVYDINQFNLKLRVYREPQVELGLMMYQYYVVDFFFTIFFKGQTFWQGVTNRKGTEAEMRELVSFSVERRMQMIGRKETQFPKLYVFETADGGTAYVMAGMARVYAFESPVPLSIQGKEKVWLANWDIVYEEGFAGDELREDFGRF